MTTVLWLTDLAYDARGRRYGDEDVWLVARLRDRFTIAMAHPVDAVALMDGFDVVVVRNTGPVAGYQEADATFRAEAARRGTRVLNPLHAKGDTRGKQYLVDLTDAGWPVIPTAADAAGLARLPVVDRYLTKPRTGADSAGVAIVARSDLASVVLDGETLVQPWVSMEAEVSFTFVDGRLAFAVSTPDPAARWDLAPYDPTPDDLAFAQRFVDWNALGHGVERVDACRTTDGNLLLVELEDLNPYLSLDRLDAATREGFVAALAGSITSVAAKRPDAAGGTVPP